MPALRLETPATLSEAGYAAFAAAMRRLSAPTPQAIETGRAYARAIADGRLVVADGGAELRAWLLAAQPPAPRPLPAQG